MQEWKPYPRNRKIRRTDNYLVIVPESYSSETPNIPLFCEVCGFMFASKADEETYEKFKCCETCADKWAYSRSEEWKEGWRPSPEELKLHQEKRFLIEENIRFE